MFNHEKLDWFNGVYIRRMGDDELADAITPWIDGEAGGLPRERSSRRPCLSRLNHSAGARAAEEALGRAGDAVVLLPGASGVRRMQLLVQKGMDADGVRAMLEQALATAVGTDRLERVSLRISLSRDCGAVALRF